MATATPYCTNEDLAKASRNNCLLLKEEGATLAQASDGRFATDSRWTLRSAGVDFAAQGVQAGDLVLIWDDGEDLAAGAEGQVFLADEGGVAANTLVLRRPGLDSGQGQPPGRADLAVGSLRFVVLTYAPTIEQASYKLNVRFGIDDNTVSRGSDDLYDPRALQEVCVLGVLRRLTLAAWIKAKDDAWKAHTDFYKQEYEDLLAAVNLRWGPDGLNGPATSPASIRVSR